MLSRYLGQQGIMIAGPISGAVAVSTACGVNRQEIPGSCSTLRRMDSVFRGCSV